MLYCWRTEEKVSRCLEIARPSEKILKCRGFLCWKKTKVQRNEKRVVRVWEKKTMDRGKKMVLHARGCGFSSGFRAAQRRIFSVNHLRGGGGVSENMGGK